MNDLSPRAKKLLRDKYDKLYRENDVVLGTGPTAKEIRQWCDEHGIDLGSGIQNNRQGKVSRTGIDTLEQTLSAHYASIFTDFSQDNHARAALKSFEEKSGKIKPTHHLLLVALTRPSEISPLGKRFYLAEQFNLELDVDALDVSVFDSLVVVENRDSFNDWHKYHKPKALELALVIYRGDNGHSVACKTLRQIWRQNYPEKPLVYFGDLDLAGLRIAVSAEYSSLLLPDFEWLQENLIAQHYPQEQEKYLAGLNRDCPEPWRIFLDLISKQRAGLRQQWMYDKPLTLSLTVSLGHIKTQ
ncbi:MAG: hypothetical protein ACI8Z9_002327 [Paraglaciecola sp.]|jgi:hypothetical protein